MSKRRREKIKAKTANKVQGPKKKRHTGPLEIKCFMGPEFFLSGINYNNRPYKKGDRRKAR